MIKCSELLSKKSKIAMEHLPKKRTLRKTIDETSGADQNRWVLVLVVDFAQQGNSVKFEWQKRVGCYFNE